MQACRKPEMHWMTPEWLKPLNCQKYPVYTEYSPPRPEFHSVSLYGCSFFQIIEVFGFHIGYNDEFQKFVKNQETQYLKNPKEYFCEAYWEENWEEVSNIL